MPFDSSITRRLFAGRKTEKLLAMIVVASGTVVALTILTMPFYYVFIPIFLGMLAYWGWQLVKNVRT